MVQFSSPGACTSQIGPTSLRTEPVAYWVPTWEEPNSVGLRLDLLTYIYNPQKWFCISYNFRLWQPWWTDPGNEIGQEAREGATYIFLFLYSPISKFSKSKSNLMDFLFRFWGDCGGFWSTQYRVCKIIGITSPCWPDFPSSRARRVLRLNPAWETYYLCYPYMLAP